MATTNWSFFPAAPDKRNSALATRDFARYFTAPAMSDTPPEFDLKFLPDWLKEAPATQKYADYEGPSTRERSFGDAATAAIRAAARVPAAPAARGTAPRWTRRPRRSRRAARSPARRPRQPARAAIAPAAAAVRAATTAARGDDAVPPRGPPPRPAAPPAQVRIEFLPDPAAPFPSRSRSSRAAAPTRSSARAGSSWSARSAIACASPRTIPRSRSTRWATARFRSTAPRWSAPPFSPSARSITKRRSSRASRSRGTSPTSRAARRRADPRADELPRLPADAAPALRGALLAPHVVPGIHARRGANPERRAVDRRLEGAGALHHHLRDAPRGGADHLQDRARSGAAFPQDVSAGPREVRARRWSAAARRAARSPTAASRTPCATPGSASAVSR